MEIHPDGALPWCKPSHCSDPSLKRPSSLVESTFAESAAGPRPLILDSHELRQGKGRG